LKHKYVSFTLICQLGQYAWPTRPCKLQQGSNRVVKICIETTYKVVRIRIIEETVGFGLLICLIT